MQFHCLKLLAAFFQYIQFIHFHEHTFSHLSRYLLLWENGKQCIIRTYESHFDKNTSFI